MDFSKFDMNADALESIKKELATMPIDGSGERKDVPAGEYEVTITKLELKESKSGKPMVAIWFKIVNGPYNGQMIFYNQVIEKAFQLHLIKQFFVPFALQTPITFESYTQFADCLSLVKQELDKVEFALDYTVNEKGYSAYTVTQVFSF